MICESLKEAEVQAQGAKSAFVSVSLITAGTAPSRLVTGYVNASEFADAEFDSVIEEKIPAFEAMAQRALENKRSGKIKRLP